MDSPARECSGSIWMIIRDVIRVNEAARKDIERAFGVLQDEEFEVNFRDMFVNPAPNIVRDWVERCDLHVRKTKELRDRKTHNELRKDLVEHLWNNDDE
ncbi:hypothetical protein Tco_0688984 [Tanacetum coccineum]